MKTLVVKSLEEKKFTCKNSILRMKYTFILQQICIIKVTNTHLFYRLFFVAAQNKQFPNFMGMIDVKNLTPSPSLLVIVRIVCKSVPYSSLSLLPNHMVMNNVKNLTPRPLHYSSLYVLK